MISRIFLRILVVNLFFISLFAHADNVSAVVPESIPGVRTLTAESMIELAQVFESLILIDSRITEDRSIGYIEDSVSLPDTETSCSSLNRISIDHQVPVVFYCNGIYCGRSVTAVNIAKSCDFSNLFWFKGGFEEWRVKDYPYMLD